MSNKKYLFKLCCEREWLKQLLFTVLFQFSFTCVEAQKIDKTYPHHTFYIGAMGGYGSTTWSGLVPSAQNQNIALNLSTPIEVKEGGGVWGGLVGYEITPFFAVEANYMSYPTGSVFFDSSSLFSWNNNERTLLTTDTESLSLMAKIMLLIPNSQVRLFSSAGVADIHRKDLLIDQWRPGPAFGLGFNYRMTEHLMGEIAGHYAAGFGESQLDPSETFIPFLYSVSVRLAYFF